MGSTASAITGPGSSSPLPDTELTPCAILLYRMGVRVVAFSFEHAVVNGSRLIQTHTLRGRFVVNPYLEARRQELVGTLAAHIPNEACTFIVSLLAQGIAVVMISEADQQRNGEVIKASSSEASSATVPSTGYQFDGEPLVQAVLWERLGPDLARMIHVDTLSSVMRHKHPAEIMLVTASSDLVRKARKRHMSAIHVSETLN